MTDTAATTTRALSGWLRHPILAWHAYHAALAERADAKAVTAGMTVQVLPSGMRRYRHAHLDEPMAAYRARHTTQDQAEVPASGPVPPGWSPVRLVTAEAWSR